MENSSQFLFCQEDPFPIQDVFIPLEINPFLSNNACTFFLTRSRDQINQSLYLESITYDYRTRKQPFDDLAKKQKR